ncbi:hypothetical protein BJ165DRAFT_575776 [Panaeolus papilionaceus]|nr:hypothetical protein BJ165DRAFT_575776 [Panaeolus papilionaceus]
MASPICRLAAPPPAGPTPSPPSSNNQPLPPLIPTPSPPTDIPPSSNANTAPSTDTTNAPPVPSNPGHAVGNIPILSNSVTESPHPSNTIISVSSNRPTLTITLPASSNNTGTGAPLSTTAEHNKVNTGAIAGGVIGGLVALALLISLGVYVQRRARDARIEKETMREMERVVPQPPPVDDEVYGYGYGTGTPMGMPYPNEKGTSPSFALKGSEAERLF